MVIYRASVIPYTPRTLTHTQTNIRIRTLFIMYLMYMRKIPSVPPRGSGGGRGKDCVQLFCRQNKIKRQPAIKTAAAVAGEWIREVAEEER